MRVALLIAFVLCACGKPAQGPGPPALLSAASTVELGRVLSPNRRIQSFTVQNLGTVDVNLKNIERVNGSPEITASLGALLVRSGTSVNAVTFTLESSTTLVADYRAEFVLRSDAADLHVTVTATGVFVDCGGPAFFDFGGALVGDTLRRDFTVINTSGVRSTASFELPANPNFSVVGGGTVMLEPGQAMLVHLAFHPTSLMQLAAIATIRPHELCPSRTMQLLGSGEEHVVFCDIEPEQVGFCTPGRTCAAEVLLHSRLVEPLPLTEVTVVPRPVFELATDAGLVLPPAQRVAGEDIFIFTPSALHIPLRLTPAGDGGQYGTFTVQTGMSMEPTVSCALVGWGGGPLLEVTPAELDFGTLTGPKTLPFTVRNAGTLETSVNADTIPLLFIALPEPLDAVTDGAALEVTDAGHQYALNPGETRTLWATVTPSDAGTALSWRVRLITDDPSQPDAGLPVRANR